MRYAIGLVLAVAAACLTSGCDDGQHSAADYMAALNAGRAAAAVQPAHTAHPGVVSVASHETLDAWGNPSGYMRSSANGETVIKTYKTTYQGRTAVLTTKTTRRSY